MNYDRWIARWEGEGGAIVSPASASKRSSGEQTKVITLRTILVPIDFSPDSLKTLQYAELLGKRVGAKLHLVHVVTRPFVARARRAGSWLMFSKEVTANARKRLAELATEFSLPGHPKPYTVRSGKAADEINEVARASNAGLIAIATRGYTGLKHAFLGSTTERVVRTTPCPVLVVREKERTAAKERARSGRAPLQFRTILVPVDFSENSGLGVEYGLRFAQEFGATVVLFHSVFVPVYEFGHKDTARRVPKLIADQQEYARDEMEKLARKVSGKGRKIETKVAFGSPVEQIGDYVEKENVDLIITSTHGRSGLQRVFIGSTAEHIVRHAPCSVLVVPNRLAREKAKKGSD